MRIAESERFIRAARCGVQISANKKSQPLSTNPTSLATLCVKLYEHAHAVKDNLKLFRKILVTSSDWSVRNLTSTLRKNRNRMVS